MGENSLNDQRANCIEGPPGRKRIFIPYMYILECADGTYYTGSTYNLVKRVEEHNQGEGANYTSKRLPVKLIYSEEFNGIEEAFKREKQIQNWAHAKKKALIEKDYEELKKKAKKRF